MTSQQRDRIKEFENEVKKRAGNAATVWTESKSPESRGVLFADIDGVTLVVYPNGLISIPAVRTYHPPKYPTPVIAAACANELWVMQKARDEANPNAAKKRKTGHLGPTVDTNLKCRNKDCPCDDELSQERQKRARGGFNTDPNRSS